MRSPFICSGLILLASACTTQTRGEEPFDFSAGGGASSGSGSGGGASDGDDGHDTAEPATSGSEGGDDSDFKFDIGNGLDLTGPTGDPSGAGCEKVDFLFVIDNSGSMADEQQNLATSFPGFISAITRTVVTNYHVMVVDTDAAAGGSCNVSNIGAADCDMWCDTQCPPGCDCTCNGTACGGGLSECDETLGAGKILDQSEDPCGIAGAKRYMDETQPDLADTFACVATVGTVGDGNERPMQAAIEAITTQTGPGECNEGFLRDDALLVATVITDEEDAGKSPGDPASWHQALVDAKLGDPGAVVALALVGDTDVPGGLCEPYDMGGDGAEDAPRLRAWAEAFVHGTWASVCAPDYAPFFADAVGVIETACDEYVPPG